MSEELIFRRRLLPARKVRTIDSYLNRATACSRISGRLLDDLGWTSVAYCRCTLLDHFLMLRDRRLNILRYSRLHLLIELRLSIVTHVLQAEFLAHFVQLVDAFRLELLSLVRATLVYNTFDRFHR